jgi:hypothetical protein
MKEKDVHTSRLNFMLSPKLKKSVSIAAHANMMSVSDYIRGLIYKDLIENSELVPMDIYDSKAVYVVKHELPSE